VWASPDRELRSDLEQALGGRLDMIRLRRYPYGTSHPLFELDLGGERLLLKDTTARHPAIPPFLHDAEREREVYRRLLVPAGIGPRFRGSAGGRLLLEKVEARELWQLRHEAWPRVAAWLAGAHRTLAPFTDIPSLLSIDEAYLSLWPARAGLEPALRRAHRHATQRLLALPRVVIHNEFYPSNVLLTAERVVPVDWELAAAGPAVLDLAALAVGWTGKKLDAILSAYGDVDRRDLAAAQLHLATRWLGWSKGWTPPPAHRHDWLTEAVSAAALLLR
jgi:Phosphotransferase enzyme family